MVINSKSVFLVLLEAKKFKIKVLLDSGSVFSWLTSIAFELCP